MAKYAKDAKFHLLSAVKKSDTNLRSMCDHLLVVLCRYDPLRAS